MGNYLQSLRAPPQTFTEAEHERHHPLYYDWSLPKWSPFRVEHPPAQGVEGTSSQSQGSNLAAESANGRRKDNKTQPQATGGSTSNHSGGKLVVAAKSAIKSAKETIQKSLKSTLTNDRAESKPVDANTKTSQEGAKKPKTSGGKSTGGRGSGGNHKQTTREAAHAASSMRKSNDGHQAATTMSIKKVDSTRPQTIDPARDGGIDDQAALKAATNIHTVTAKGSSAAASATRKRVPAN